MLHYERTYATARGVFSFLEFVGWTLAVVGSIFAIVGLVTGGFTSAFRDPPLIVRIIAMLPGLGIVIGGLVSVGFAQLGRANVDTAEMTRELLALARRENQGPTDGTGNREEIRSGSVDERVAEVQPTSSVSETIGEKPPTVSISEADAEEIHSYRGYKIFKLRGRGFFVKDRDQEYEDLDAARIAIDRRTQTSRR